MPVYLHWFASSTSCVLMFFFLSILWSPSRRQMLHHLFHHNRRTRIYLSQRSKIEVNFAIAMNEYVITGCRFTMCVHRWSSYNAKYNQRINVYHAIAIYLVVFISSKIRHLQHLVSDVLRSGSDGPAQILAYPNRKIVLSVKEQTHIINNKTYCSKC